MTRNRFLARFPDDDACLEHLRERRFPDGAPCPSCDRPSRFHRVSGRTAYACQYCRHHVHPAAGTIMARSAVGLQRWFWAIYLVSSTSGTLTAHELERELGVSYKTAARMLSRIRAAAG